MAFLSALAYPLSRGFCSGRGGERDANLDAGQSAALLRSDCRFIGPSTSLSPRKKFFRPPQAGNSTNRKLAATAASLCPQGHRSGNYKFRQWIMKSDFWARGSVKASPNEAMRARRKELFGIGSVARLRARKRGVDRHSLNAMFYNNALGCGWCTSGLIDLHHNKVVDMWFLSSRSQAAFCAGTPRFECGFSRAHSLASRTIRSFSSFLLVDFTPWWCA